MSEQKVYLDDIYASEKCSGSAFKAVVLMAHEARFLNEQERMGNIQMEKKPTTIAMDKFKRDRLEMTKADGNDAADDFYQTEAVEYEAIEGAEEVQESAAEVLGADFIEDVVE